MELNTENVKVLLPEGCRVAVTHFHQGNDPEGRTRRIYQRVPTRHLPRYVSVARILKAGQDVPVAVGTAVCSHGDTPSRQMGWSLSVERALQCLIDKKEPNAFWIGSVAALP